MNSKSIIAILIAATTLTACQQNGYSSDRGVLQGGSSVNKQDVGTLAGGIAGGVIGHNIGGGRGQTIATIAGALIGAGIGNSIGASLDNADRAALSSRTTEALEYRQPGESLPWSNPNTGHGGTIVPGKYYRDNGGYCREFTQRINVGGRVEEGYGTACRQPDGSWQIVDQ